VVIINYSLSPTGQVCVKREVEERLDETERRLLDTRRHLQEKERENRRLADSLTDLRQDVNTSRSVDINCLLPITIRLRPARKSINPAFFGYGGDGCSNHTFEIVPSQPVSALSQTCSSASPHVVLDVTLT